MDMRKWFKEAQYGMMVHWGLYSLLAGEYNGKVAEHKYGEWIQSHMRIPNAEYEKLAKAFNRYSSMQMNGLNLQKSAV